MAIIKMNARSQLQNEQQINQVPKNCRIYVAPYAARTVH